MGWRGLKNGVLLARAAAEAFDAVLTRDTGMEHQQNLRDLPVAVVAIRARSNKLEDLRPLVPAVLDALANLSPRTFVTVG